MTAEVGYGILAETGDLPGGAQAIVPSPLMSAAAAVTTALRLDAEATLSGLNLHHHAVALTRVEDLDRERHPAYWQAAAALPAGWLPPSAHLHPEPPVAVDPTDPLRLTVLRPELVEEIRDLAAQDRLGWHPDDAVPGLDRPYVHTGHDGGEAA